MNQAEKLSFPTRRRGELILQVCEVKETLNKGAGLNSGAGRVFDDAQVHVDSPEEAFAQIVRLEQVTASSLAKGIKCSMRPRKFSRRVVFFLSADSA